MDIHSLIGKIPRPDKGFVLPGHKYTGPYNPLHNQLDENDQPLPGNEPYNAVDEISLHQAIAAFYSDFTLMTTALRPHGLSYLSPSLQCASIDHAMYFHKPFRVDDWMLYDMDATVSASSRGLNFGRMWQNGELVCSTTQEGLIRLREIEANKA